MMQTISAGARMRCFSLIISPLTHPHPAYTTLQTQILRAELVSLRQVGAVVGDGDIVCILAQAVQQWDTLIRCTRGL